MQKELDLLHTERELMHRELELARREIELLRQIGRASNTSVEQPKTNLRVIGDLLSDFSGAHDAFWKWERQLLLLKSTYNLDDNSTRILAGSKLKGNALDWFHSKPEHIEMSLDELLDEMRGMFDHRPNKLTVRRQFESRRWKMGESFSEYYHDKIILANCVPVPEEEIIDYMIEGIPDIQLQNQARIQNFDSKAAMLKAFEKISLQREDTKSRGNRDSYKPGYRPMQGRSSSENAAEARPSRKCFHCQKEGHVKAVCPELLQVKTGCCFRCGKSGHRAKDCPVKNSQVNNVNSAPVESDEYFKRVVYVMCNDEGHRYELDLMTLLDTGSPVSFIKLCYVSSDVIECANEYCNKFQGINGTALTVLGTVNADVEFNGKRLKNLRLLVVPDYTMVSPVVFGRDTIRRFDLGLRDLTTEDVSAVTELMSIEVATYKEDEADTLSINPEMTFEMQNRVREIFRDRYVKPVRPDDPKVKAELKLTLNNHQPFFCQPRRLSYFEKDQVRMILDKLLDKGYIRPSKSEYASPIVLVKKKNGELRMCVDYRTLNKLTCRDNYPLPLIEDQLDVLNGKKYFSILDLKDGFHHVRVAEDSVKYTSFVTPLGQFEYVRMPFGLKGAPPAFQRFVNEVLKDLIDEGNVIVYMDDILVATETLDQHLKTLQSVFDTLVDSKLELRLDKCKLLFNEIEYLGYRVSQDGIRPTREGIEAIERYPVPNDVRGVKRFLGMCSYFRKFIEGFSTIAKPLSDLSKKDVSFKFDDNEMQAFTMLKQKLIEAPILSIYSPRDDTELHCDASSLGFGAVLLQRKSDGKLHPVFYFSKRTTNTESMYHSFELETLSIIYALRRFRIYLQGIKFKIVTDCNSLKMTLSKKELNPRIARWALELQSFDYEIEHRAGTGMQHVDALSRAVNVMVVEDNPFEVNLSVSQCRDPVIRELRDQLEKAEHSLYEMRNGLVYRKERNELLFYVPCNMIAHVIRKCHDEMGHLSVEKTCGAIRATYWFPKMKERVKSYVQDCLKCIAFNPVSGKSEGYLHCLPKGNLPFTTIHIDHYGPIERERSTKKYILVVIDSFTKYVKLYATKTTATKEVIDALRRFFNNYSRPKCIVSDRGTSFSSSEFREFMEENHIKHVQIATGSPKANGQVERINRILGPMLGKLVDATSGQYWYKVLGDVEYALNNSVNKSTGETPAKLLFGVNQRGKIPDAIKDYVESEIATNKRDLETVRAKAATNIDRSQESNKRYFDKKRKDAHKYNTDDLVMIKNFDSTAGTSQKLIPRFKGPYRVIRVLRNDRYVIADAENH